MKFFVIIIIIIIVLSSIYPAPAGEPASKPSHLVLRNAVLIDGVSPTPLTRQTIVIKGDTIEEIYRAGSPPRAFPKDALIMDLSGQFVMPGLIDAHVHISHEKRPQIEAIMKAALLGGITSVRDMGGDARVLASISRDALLNEIDSPNIYYSALMAGPTFFTDPRVIDGTKGLIPGYTPWAKEITSRTDMKLAIAEARGCGARGIKIYADLPADEIKRICDSGHRQGMKIWSHATIHPARPSDAVEAGVDVISHAPLLAWQHHKEVPSSYSKRYSASYDLKHLQSPVYKLLFAEMVKHGTILDATVYLFTLPDFMPGDSQEKKKALAAYAIEVTKMAHKAGVRIAVGTDFMLDKKKPLPNLHDELEVLVKKCGLTPMQALHAVTRINAEATGILHYTGTIRKGKRADLLILRKDPSKDIRHTRAINYIIKSGKVYSRL